VPSARGWVVPAYIPRAGPHAVRRLDVEWRAAAPVLPVEVVGAKLDLVYPLQRTKAVRPAPKRLVTRCSGA
jgi:hypothetical protein